MHAGMPQGPDQSQRPSHVDDIVIKTREARTLIDDLRETFDTLDRYKIKLNPEKCAFGVPSGQLLGYFISQRGIEANPKKIRTIMAMEKPKNLKGVQQCQHPDF